MRRLIYLGPALAAAVGAAHLALLLYIMLARVAFPFDLEWMEGGMLCHALRVMQGKPLYAPPSAEFISFLYTPFYPFLLGVLGKIVGLSYALGRILSVLSFLAALVLAFLVVARQVGGGWLGRLWGIAAVGLVASSFQHTGAWFDLVRNDTLYLALIAGCLFLLCYRPGSSRAVILAAVLASLAFLTKQTASLFIVFSGLALLFLSWRRLPIFVAGVGILAGGSVLLLNHFSSGWFWRYTYGMHQGHDLYWNRLWPGTELTLLTFFPIVFGVMGLWVAATPVLWLLRRDFASRDRGDLYWLFAALTGVLVSAVGFATQWAAANAYIPGLFFPSVFAALACADLAQKVQMKKERPLLVAAVSFVLGGALALQMARDLYRPEKHLPTEADRRGGEALIAALREIDGPVLVPYHPYYPVLAGKEPSYHQMGINDVTRAGYPFPPDVYRRIMMRYYRAILLDNSPQGRYDFLYRQYKLDHFFKGTEVPRPITGYEVHPRFLFVLKERELLPAGARRLFDFEDGTFTGWSLLGTAFGERPVEGPILDQGPVGPFEGFFLASSYHGGDEAKGMLTSSEFVVDRPWLSYRAGGGKRPGELVIRLIVEGKEVYSASGTGTDVMEERRVDVRSYLGRRMQIEIVDQAQGSWGHLLFDDVMLRAQ